MARIGIDIQGRDYAGFKALMPAEEKLGKNYAEWMQRRFQEDSRPGESVTSIAVYPEEFRLYCLQIGQKPSYSVLEAFASSKAREE